MKDGVPSQATKADVLKVTPDNTSRAAKMALCPGARRPESNFGTRDREQDDARDDAEEGDDGHRSARTNRWPACHGD